MVDYSEIGKGGIVKEGIFNRFEKLEPALLDNYWSDKHRKLMIVAESNYFRNDVDSVFKDPNAWYQGDASIIKQFLKDQEKKVSNWKYYKTFSKLCKVMNEVANIHCKSVYEEAIFYNYFLRPATVKETNRSFEKDCTQLDRDVAGIALCGVLDILKPDIVIFASKYAHEEFVKYTKSVSYNTNIQIDFIIHPVVRNWYENEAGGPKFEKLLKDYWIKNSTNQIVSIMENKAPWWLAHKPIITVDYKEIDEVGDAEFLTLGHASWDQKNAYSAKIWRRVNDHWSRQSEELPLWRLLDLAILLAETIKRVDNGLELKKEYVQNREDIEEFKSFIQEDSEKLKERLKKLKEILNENTK